MAHLDLREPRAQLELGGGVVLSRLLRARLLLADEPQPHLLRPRHRLRAALPRSLQLGAQAVDELGVALALLGRQVPRILQRRQMRLLLRRQRRRRLALSRRRLLVGREQPSAAAHQLEVGGGRAPLRRRGRLSRD